jgi:hypothetical protein
MIRSWLLHAQLRLPAAAADDAGLSGLKSLILNALGTALVVLVAWRVTEHYAKREWGWLITSVLAAVIPFWFCFWPDNAASTLKGWAGHIG